MNARAINLILVGIIVSLLGITGYLVFLLKAGPPPIQHVTQGRVVTNTVTQIAVRKINATNLLAALANRPANWAALESTNYYVYIANLRAFGCPAETIKDIILTDIARLYSQRRAALRTQGQPYKFWLPNGGIPGAASAKVQKQLAELDREQRALVKELLGVDLQNELAKYWGTDEPQEYRYDFLAPAKREQVQAVQAKYDELEQQFFSRVQGLMLDEDEEQLKTLQQQREAELAQVLTPEELEEYDLRNSSVAETLRSQLSGFEPTEDEFRRLFRLNRDFDKEFNQAFNATDEAQMEIRMRAQEEAQQALNDEAKKILGDDRYAEYQRAQDPDYKALVQLTDRFELPQEVAGKVYNLKVEAERQKQILEANPNLTEEQRLAALGAIAQETERQVNATMGEKYFKSYRKAAGHWLNNLLEPQNVPAPEQ